MSLGKLTLTCDRCGASVPTAYVRTANGGAHPVAEGWHVSTHGDHCPDCASQPCEACQRVEAIIAQASLPQPRRWRRRPS
jgi:hypothetical protein